MRTVNAADAAEDICGLIDSVCEGGEPLTITSEKGNAVLMNEEEWNAVTETLYLLSVPDMLRSLEEAETMDISECATWDSIKDAL